jgi:hypothetical protein
MAGMAFAMLLIARPALAQNRTQADYCDGLSPELCGRVQAIVESGQRPAYCRNGFGVDKSLSREQVIACFEIVRRQFLKEGR